MKPRQSERGVAMVIVLWVIMVLSLLISGFAFTMHVETQVASFSRKELKAEMLARSGIEVARMQIMLDEKSPTDAGFDALNQEWATNTELYVEHELGEGKYNVTVTDEERKLPVNKLSPDQWHKLLEVLGVDPLEADTITDSVADWIDENDLHQLNGAENDYYSSLEPPYKCKNGPLDRIEELLMIRGVTPELFNGTAGDEDGQGARPGLKDLLTTMTGGQVNVNTAGPVVLQALFGLDDAQLNAIIERRDGIDGVPGTEDDQPFHSADEVFGALGSVTPDAKKSAGALLTINSQFFHVKSTGAVGGAHYTIDAVIRRQGANNFIVAWREGAGS